MPLSKANEALVDLQKGKLVGYRRDTPTAVGNLPPSWPACPGHPRLPCSYAKEKRGCPAQAGHDRFFFNRRRIPCPQNNALHIACSAATASAQEVMAPALEVLARSRPPRI